MKKQLIVSKTDQHGRVIEVKEQNPYADSEILRKGRPQGWAFNYDSGVKSGAEIYDEEKAKYDEAESLLKTFPVVQDGEVEKLVDEKLNDLYSSVPDKQSEGMLHEAFSRGFFAHAQKYGYSLEEMRKCFDAGRRHEYHSQFGTVNPAPQTFDEYNQSLRPTLGQLVECEVSDGIAKIL